MADPPASLDLASDRVAQLALDAQQDGHALQQLIALLEEPRWSARREVIAALAGLGQLAVPGLCASLAAVRQSETRIAATVDTLVASSGDVEAAAVALTTHDNPAVIADAAQILGRRRNPKSVPILIQLLGHTDDNVAVAAIEALGRIGGRAAVDDLVATVERDYFFRTYPAIDVLGRSEDPRSVAPLARLLSKPQYALEAARALGRTAEKSAVPPLLKLLTSAIDADVRAAASAIAELIERHRERYGSAQQITDSVRQYSSKTAITRLHDALAGAESQERVALCVILGALEDPAAAPALLGLLDAEPVVASAAIAALRQLGRAADAPLRAALHSGSSARRLILLPLFPQTGGSAEVLQCLQDADAGVRAMACDALARMGDTSVVPALFERLRETNQRVVQAAMSAIQSLGTNETEALAVAAARDAASPSTRRAGLRILSYFGFVTALDVFAHAKSDPDPRVQDVAITGLALVDHPRARELLLDAARDPSERVRSAVMRGLGETRAESDVIAALRRALSDDDAWVRYYACQALGKLRVVAADADIVKLLPDTAGQVRVAAVEALSHLKSETALRALELAAAANEPDIRRAALIGLGMIESPASLPVLIDACAAEDAATRLIALSAVGERKAPETLAVVARALGDADEGVRVAAIGLLASWPAREATALLVDALRTELTAASSDQSERIRAITTGLATPVEGRVEGLLAALDAADDELALALSSLLGRVDPSDHASAAMYRALKLPNVAARKAAAAMLAARGTREALAALSYCAAHDPDDQVRRVCALLSVP